MKNFFTFEGIDGSGKSTISKNIYDDLKSKGHDVILTYEPTNSYIGKCVKRFIKEESDPFSTAFAFIADRIEHCKKIKNWLEKGKIVLCDRYSDSTYAYQAAQMENIIINPIKWLKELSDDKIIAPEKTFLFIIDPKDSIKRIQDRKELIAFEKIEFLEKVHKNYLKLANSKRYIILDANKNIETLVKEIIDKIL